MIFYDSSSFFIALLNKKDKHHKRASEIADKITEETVVSELVVAESVGLIRAVAGGKAGYELYNFIIDNCKIVYVDEDLLRTTMETHLKYDGKLSVTDATSIGIMALMEIKKIASFDTDFDRVKGIKRVSSLNDL